MTVFFGCRKNYFCIKEFDSLPIILLQGLLINLQ